MIIGNACPPYHRRSEHLLHLQNIRFVRIVLHYSFGGQIYQLREHQRDMFLYSSTLLGPCNQHLDPAGDQALYPRLQRRVATPVTPTRSSGDADYIRLSGIRLS